MNIKTKQRILNTESYVLDKCSSIDMLMDVGKAEICTKLH